MFIVIGIVGLFGLFGICSPTAFPGNEFYLNDCSLDLTAIFCLAPIGGAVALLFLDTEGSREAMRMLSRCAFTGIATFALTLAFCSDFSRAADDADGIARLDSHLEHRSIGSVSTASACRSCC